MSTPNGPRGPRSPKYPGLDLKTAIDRTAAFYGSAYDHAIGVEAACDIWGLTFKGGKANRELSALVQFGLLKSEGKGDNRMLRISDRGRDIVTDPDGVTKERSLAIQGAALVPKTYRKAWGRWGPRLPSDDRAMAPVLVR